MLDKQSYFEKIAERFEVNDVVDLDFEAMSLVMNDGTHILSWVMDAEDGNYILLLPFMVDMTIDDEGKKRVMLSRLNCFSDEIYYVMSSQKVLTSGTMTKTCFELYEGASDEWLKEIGDEEASEEKSVDKKDDNVLEFSTSKKTIH